MGFGISGNGSGGGEYRDQVRYNTKEGRIYRVDSEKVGENWERNIVEITDDFAAVLDLKGIEIGWIKFNNGVDFKMVPANGDIGPKPSGDHKEGFRLGLILGGNCNGSDESDKVREIAGTASLLIEGITTIYDAAMANADVEAGTHCPVIKLAETERIVGRHGANFKPVFEIVKFIPTPEAFTAVAEPETFDDGEEDDGLPF